MKFRCGHCGAKKFWKLGNGEYRCRSCRRDFRPRPIPSLKLERAEWLELAKLFLIGANSPTIKEKLGKSIASVQKALKILRVCMTADVPEIFSEQSRLMKLILEANGRTMGNRLKPVKPQAGED